MLYAILGIISVISIILLFITIYYNKFRFAIIKIEEAENNIDILFEKKIQLLERTTEKQGYRIVIDKEMLAEKLNVSDKAVSRWENNLVEPSIDILNISEIIAAIKVDKDKCTYNDAEDVPTTIMIIIIKTFFWEIARRIILNKS